MKYIPLSDTLTHKICSVTLEWSISQLEIIVGYFGLYRHYLAAFNNNNNN